MKSLLGVAFVAMFGGACHSQPTWVPAPKQQEGELRFRAAYGFQAEIDPIVQRGAMTLSIDSASANALVAKHTSSDQAYRPLAKWLWREIDCWDAVKAIDILVMYEVKLGGSWGVDVFRVSTKELGGSAACSVSVA